MATLKQYSLKSFSKGANSYAASRSMVEDEEIPQGGQNVVLDDNGSASKVNGMTKYCSEEIADGKPIRGMAQFRTASINKLIVASGTAWYDVTTTGKNALTGMTFTDDKDTFFCQALGRLYGCNGTNNLAYTSNGTSITEVSANGNIGDQIIFYNQRLYMTNSSNLDRVYYSNPYKTADGTLGDFGTFDTNLSATPAKNAGFLMFDPGSGEEITHLRVVKNYLYVYTKRNVWRVSASAQLNEDNSINHTVELLVEGNGTPSSRGAVQVGNDIWHYNYDNVYSLGEVANFANIRSTTKSARIKSEINSVAVGGRDNFVMGQYKEKVYNSYQTGTYNDRLTVYDVRLNAWSTPIIGKNISCFLDWEDSDGTHRFLAGSSNGSNSYVYQLESGTDDDGTAINAFFETKSTDCGKPGLVKRFAFIEVFYSMVYGKLSYEVKIDETTSTTGSQQLGNSTDRPVGIGSMMIGSFPVGSEYDPNTEFADLSQNSSFTIDCGFEEGKRIAVKFSNSNSGEQFKINGITIHYKEGSPYESLT
jgi:hypothetical protein